MVDEKNGLCLYREPSFISVEKCRCTAALKRFCSSMSNMVIFNPGRHVNTQMVLVLDVCEGSFESS